jgi:hypothetical protein
VSMGVVGVKSTAGRAVKCVDPSKTTRSESAWLGYPSCVMCNAQHILHIHNTMKNEGWGIKED